MLQFRQKNTQSVEWKQKKRGYNSNQRYQIDNKKKKKICEHLDPFRGSGRASERASERGRRDGAVLSDTYLVPTYVAIRGLKPHLEVLIEIFQIGKDLRSQMTSQDDKFENIFNIYIPT